MPEYALELCNICRRVNSEFSLENINLQMEKGSTCALVGKNASGKSSLLKVICGVLPPNSGEVFIQGKKAEINSPAKAKENSIFLLSQNGRGFPGLNIAENIYFGRELTKPGTKFLDNSAMLKNCQRVFDDMGCALSCKAKLQNLTAAQMQLVGLASAVLSNASVILMDEPTSRLSPREKAYFGLAMQGLKKRGVSFLLVSHDTQEIMELGDKVCVMEGGKLTDEAPKKEADFAWLTEKLLGYPVRNIYKRERATAGEEVLHLSNPARGIEISLCAGEVVAITGSADCGAEEAILSAAGFCQGKWEATVGSAAIKNPVDAIRAGVSLGYTSLWEEKLSIFEKAEKRRGSTAILSWRAATEEVLKLTGGSLKGVVGMGGQEGEYCTGGNQQRELMERALSRPAKVFVLYCPTSGMDIPSRMSLYSRLGEMAKNGAAFLICAYSGEEAAGISDRLVVLETVSV